MNRFFALAAATLCISIAAMSPAQAAATATEDAPTCGAPSELTRLDQVLARTGARLAKGQPLRIVAFGSSSTAGNGASSQAHNYPTRLEAELRSRLPGHEIIVINRGIAGEDAEEMVARIRSSVLVEKPDLVIWQVGTNALLGDFALAIEARLIRRGLRQLQATGVDVILLDPQYAPKVIAKSKAPQMVSLMGRIGQRAHVGVFHRFSIMQHWRQQMNLSFGQFVSHDGLHMNDWSYDCTAKLLADAIVEASARQVPAATPMVSRAPKVSRKTRA